jgi:hypothetical protein
MLTVKPWSKEIEKIFKQLQKNNGRTFTHNVNINRELGRRCPQLIDKNYLDVSPASHKKKRYWINLLPDTVIESRPVRNRDKFIKYDFIKKF